MKQKKKIIFFILALFSIGGLAQNQKVGINTSTPEATLDIKGHLIVREIPVIEREGNFYALGYNERNEIVTKSKEVSEYSTYLGFDPMAVSHTKVLPLKLEENYVMILKGFAIGACKSVKIDFEFMFMGEEFISGKLQGVATKENKKYSLRYVTKFDRSGIYGRAFESMAKVTDCNGNMGHKLQYNTQTKELTISFEDRSPFFPNAGAFVLTNIYRIKQTN